MSLTSFLSFATSAPNNIGLVRNELQHVDLPTGKTHTHKHKHAHTHCNISFFPSLKVLTCTVILLFLRMFLFLLRAPADKIIKK